MKYKLLALDLDNTIVKPSNGLIDPVDITTIRSCVENNILVVLCSARSPRAMKFYWQQLGLTTPVVAYNGGLIWDYSDTNPLKSWNMSREELYTSMTAIRQVQRVHVWFESEDCWITERIDTEPVRIHMQRGGQPTEVGRVDAWLDRPINKILIYGDGLLKLGPILQLYNLNVTSYTDPEMLEIRPNNVDKGSALSWFCESMAIPLEEVMAIGDDSNDVPMFVRVGLSIAMGNATEDIKEAAHYTTLSIDSQGVSVAINRYLKF